MLSNLFLRSLRGHNRRPVGATSGYRGPRTRMVRSLPTRALSVLSSNEGIFINNMKVLHYHGWPCISLLLPRMGPLKMSALGSLNEACSHCVGKPQFVRINATPSITKVLKKRLMRPELLSRCLLKSSWNMRIWTIDWNSHSLVPRGPKRQEIVTYSQTLFYFWRCLCLTSEFQRVCALLPQLHLK